MTSGTSNAVEPIAVPAHWSPEQALAVLECLQAVREAVWARYGPQAQQAWRDQLVPNQAWPVFDPVRISAIADACFSLKADAVSA